jgi:hypothetical protein
MSSTDRKRVCASHPRLCSHGSPLFGPALTSLVSVVGASSGPKSTIVICHPNLLLCIPLCQFALSTFGQDFSSSSGDGCQFLRLRRADQHNVNLPCIDVDLPLRDLARPICVAAPSHARGNPLHSPD